MPNPVPVPSVPVLASSALLTTLTRNETDPQRKSEYQHHQIVQGSPCILLNYNSVSYTKFAKEDGMFDEGISILGFVPDF